MDEIKNIVNKVFESISPDKQHEQEKIQQVWRAILNDKEQKHAKISGLKNGKLYINVDASAWLYEFNLRKKIILQRMQKDAPEIKDIFFKIGKVT